LRWLPLYSGLCKQEPKTAVENLTTPDFDLTSFQI